MSVILYCRGIVVVTTSVVTTPYPSTGWKDRPELGNQQRPLNDNYNWPQQRSLLATTLAGATVKNAAPLTTGRGQLTELPPIGNRRLEFWQNHSWSSALLPRGSSPLLSPPPDFISLPFDWQITYRVRADIGFVTPSSLTLINSPITSTTTQPVGAQSIDLPPRPQSPPGKTWTQNLLPQSQSEFLPTPVGKQLTARTLDPSRPIQQTWTINLLESTLDVQTAVTTAASPFVPNTWLIFQAQIRIQGQQPPNLLPLSAPGADLRLPAGANYTDRPYVAPYPGKTWTQQLLPQSQSEYIPTPIGVQYTDRPYRAPYSGQTWTQSLLPESQSEFLPTPVGVQYTDRPYVAPYPGKTWTQQLLPQSQSEFLPTPVGVQLTSRPQLGPPPIIWNQPPNLVPLGLAGADMFLPSGIQYTDRPYRAPYAGQTWTQQLLPQSQSEFLPTPVGSQLTARTSDPARSIQQTWTNNLLEDTLDVQIVAGAAPVGAQYTDRPPPSPRAAIWNQPQDTLPLGTVGADQFLPTGVNYTDRPPLAPVRSAIWNQPYNPAVLSSLGITITYQPTPFDWQLTYSIRSAIWNQPPNMALTSALGVTVDYPVGKQLIDLAPWANLPAHKAPWDQARNSTLYHVEEPLTDPRAPFYAVQIVAGQFNRSSIAPNTLPLNTVGADQFMPPGRVYTDRPSLRPTRSAIWNQVPTLLPLGTTGADLNMPPGVNYTARPPLAPVRSAIWNQLPTLMPLATVGASQFLPVGIQLIDRPPLRARQPIIWQQPPNMALTGTVGPVVTDIHFLPFFTPVGKFRSF